MTRAVRVDGTIAAHSSSSSDLSRIKSLAFIRTRKISFSSFFSFSYFQREVMTKNRFNNQVKSPFSERTCLWFT